MWRGLVLRRKLNNIFYKLPDEIQNIVLKYVRRDHYMEKCWLPSVKKIYVNRICKLVIDGREIYKMASNSLITDHEYLTAMNRIVLQKQNTHRMLDFLIY